MRGNHNLLPPMMEGWLGAGVTYLQASGTVLNWGSTYAGKRVFPGCGLSLDRFRPDLDFGQRPFGSLDRRCWFGAPQAPVKIADKFLPAISH